MNPNHHDPNLPLRDVEDPVEIAVLLPTPNDDHDVIQNDDSITSLTVVDYIPASSSSQGPAPAPTDMLSTPVATSSASLWTTTTTTNHYEDQDDPTMIRLSLSNSSWNSKASTNSYGSTSITKTSSLMKGTMLQKLEDEDNEKNEERINPPTLEETKVSQEENTNEEDKDGPTRTDQSINATHSPNSINKTTFASTPPSKSSSSSSSPHFAIVFGTVQGRVYTIEMSIQPPPPPSRITLKDDPMHHHYTSLRRISCPLSGQSMFPLLVLPKGIEQSHASLSATSSSASKRKPQSQSSTSTAASRSTMIATTTNTTSVQSITTTTINDQTLVWVVNNDSSLVRIHPQCCFPSTLDGYYPSTATGTDSYSNSISIEEYILQQPQFPSDHQNLSEDTTIKFNGSEEPMIVRCRVHVPRFHDHHSSSTQQPTTHIATVLPLPRYISSVMAPLQDICQQMMSISSNHMAQNQNDNILSNDTGAAPVYHCRNQKIHHSTVLENIQALVYIPNLSHHDQNSDLYPTFAFYTSEGTVRSIRHDYETRVPPLPCVPESHNSDPSKDVVMPDDDDDDDGILLVSVTKAIVGTAFGAIRWGLTGGGSDPKKSKDHASSSSPKRIHPFTPQRNHHQPPPTDNGNIHPSHLAEHREPIELHMSTAFHDLPRTINFCTIDPEGRLAAAADTLGRILLIDVTTKQIIRMWKGFRDATCYWIQQLRNTSLRNQSINRQKQTIQLYLVIHSRQRRIVEVWPVRYGDRISSLSVGRDAKIIPFTMWTTNGKHQVQLAQCYIAQSTVPGSNGNRLELVHINSQELVTKSTADNIPTLPNSPVRNQKRASTTAALKLSGVSSTRSGTLRLKQLQQLLSATQMQCSIEDIRNALHDITSFVDLTTAIDLLATSLGLEDKLNVVGASFHEEVVEYCRGVVNAMIHPDAKAPNDSSLRKNPHVQMLSQKIICHEQVRHSYIPIYTNLYSKLTEFNLTFFLFIATKSVR